MRGCVIQGPFIYTEAGVLSNGFAVVEDGRIARIGTGTYDGRDRHIFSFPPDYSLVPGRIDLHIHGAAGADAMDATEESLRTIAAALPQEGTTSFLAATMTQHKESIAAALRNAGGFRPIDGEAELLGVHLEGPFLHPQRAGAQPADAILEPDLELFQEWQQLAGGSIRLVTLAPERKGGLELVRYLKEQGIVVSIGHSDATYEEAVAAMQAGASHVTHLFNGMCGMHHREPGLLGAALLREELYAEMIADGIHIHPEMVKLAWLQKGTDKIVLITDAMRAKGLPDGMYKLGGQDVRVLEGRAALSDGTLAGSVLRMDQAVRNMLVFTGCTLGDAVRMSSENPARQLGVFARKGSIAAGKDADLVVLNERHEVVMTWCRGYLSYERREEDEAD
ncbi:N-acetylglucosamine-6-phosphate deacetylase [Ectobacillus ponti]|uniref:N-acetylglucosamine-6-phosphate deacetylase n=1 Tax=Ectobacillus ponti TaxID=2961894 RepID=A0AA41XAQ8_9BACI|nr:N-acetylglucosamine-6-phosphate deacetylase [Ectobacillus ponti]MCP8969874.1 N-acetylglucosamine-6-phosphate deacetylase [Ectobacillus ponti]